MLNNVVIEGYANRLQMGAFDDGTKWFNFTLRASTYAGKDDDGTSKYDAHFFDIKGRGWTADTVEGRIPLRDSDERGVRVIVSGTLRQETWGEGDAKRSRVVLRADDVRLVDTGAPSASANGAAVPAYAGAEEPF